MTLADLIAIERRALMLKAKLGQMPDPAARDAFAEFRRIALKSSDDTLELVRYIREEFIK